MMVPVVCMLVMLTQGMFAKESASDLMKVGPQQFDREVKLVLKVNSEKNARSDSKYYGRTKGVSGEFSNDGSAKTVLANASDTVTGTEDSKDRSVFGSKAVRDVRGTPEVLGLWESERVKNSTVKVESNRSITYSNNSGRNTGLRILGVRVPIGTISASPKTVTSKESRIEVEDATVPTGTIPASSEKNSSRESWIDRNKAFGNTVFNIDLSKSNEIALNSVRIVRSQEGENGTDGVVIPVVTRTVTSSSKEGQRTAFNAFSLISLIITTITALVAVLMSFIFCLIYHSRMLEQNRANAPNVINPTSTGSSNIQINGLAGTSVVSDKAFPVSNETRHPDEPNKLGEEGSQRFFAPVALRMTQNNRRFTWSSLPQPTITRISTTSRSSISSTLHASTLFSVLLAVVKASFTYFLSLMNTARSTFVEVSTARGSKSSKRANVARSGNSLTSLLSTKASRTSPITDLASNRGLSVSSELPTTAPVAPASASVAAAKAEPVAGAVAGNVASARLNAHVWPLLTVGAVAAWPSAQIVLAVIAIVAFIFAFVTKNTKVRSASTIAGVFLTISVLMASFPSSLAVIKAIGFGFAAASILTFLAAKLLKEKAPIAQQVAAVLGFIGLGLIFHGFFGGNIKALTLQIATLFGYGFLTLIIPLVSGGSQKLNTSREHIVRYYEEHIEGQENIKIG